MRFLTLKTFNMCTNFSRTPPIPKTRAKDFLLRAMPRTDGIYVLGIALNRKILSSRLGSWLRPRKVGHRTNAAILLL